MKTSCWVLSNIPSLKKWLLIVQANENGLLEEQGGELSECLRFLHKEESNSRVQQRPEPQVGDNQGVAGISLKGWSGHLFGSLLLIL